MSELSLVPTSEQGAQKVALSYLQWLVNEDTTQQAMYRTCREYYEGDHATQLTKRMRRYLEVKTGVEFNINYCPIVVDSLAERLAVTGFKAGAGDQATQFWEWWQANRMDATQSDVHTAAVRDGDTNLIVEWDADEERPTFTFEPAYDGTDGVKVHYSQEQRGIPTMASKRWRIDQGDGAGYRRRLNLYFPDVICKYVSDEREQEGSWQPYQPEGDATWPLWWTRNGVQGGEPLGLPVIPFRNCARGYNSGRSELADAIAPQNALNKSVIDLLAGADMTAFRIYTMVGDDPSGLSTASGSWVFSPRPRSEVEIGCIPGEDLSSLLRLKDSFAMEIAIVTRTPISHFQLSRQRPAEGTLKQEESGLVAKALNRQTDFGNSWENVMYLARRMHNTFGPGGMDEEQIISTLWRDPETRNELAVLEGLALKREKLNIPLVTLWAEAGYSPEQIEEMIATDEYQARAAQQQMAVVGLGAMESEGG